MEKTIKNLWNDLESAISESSNSRKYKSLGLRNELGLRVSCSPLKQPEFLIEVSNSTSPTNSIFPSWQGMEFELIELKIPNTSGVHICLRLVDEDLRDVFIVLFADLASGLKDIQSNIERETAYGQFMSKWTRFFSMVGRKGLSLNKQQGLWGELRWLLEMLQCGVKQSIALSAWKGCERNYHDFDFQGKVIEVKTTKSKEPRKVRISNEKQLDATGLKSLHLLVVSVVVSEGGGQTLPELVSKLRDLFSQNPINLESFDSKLRKACYLDAQACHYTANFTSSKLEFFKVTEKTPKITELPNGIGDISYSLLVANCNPDLADMDAYLRNLQ